MEKYTPIYCGKVLTVCIGNSDRSPLMAGVLEMYLKNAGHNVVVESAGVKEGARNGGPASQYGIVSGSRIGIDLSTHQKTWVGDLDLAQFYLIVCASDKIAKELIEKYGVSEDKIFNADIPNPHPSTDQHVHDEVAKTIMSTMYQVVIEKFSAE